MTNDLLVGKRGSYIETQSGSYVLLSGSLAPEFIKESQLAEQPWIMPPWKNGWIEAGYGIRQVYFHLGQGSGCRNIFLDAEGCVWIATGSKVYRSAPLSNQTIKWDQIESKRLNVSTDGGRVALGKKEGNKYYFITTKQEGGINIWRISDDWRETDAELIAARNEEVYPYDFHYDGRYNNWICPSFVESSNDTYEYYIYSLDGEILDHYSAPYPGQQIAIDAYGRYWINGRGIKYVGIFESGTLQNISWYCFPPASQFRGIGETVDGDIVCPCWDSEKIIILLADSDYKSYSLVRSSSYPYKAVPAGKAVITIAKGADRFTFVYPRMGVLKTIKMFACDQPYGQGDPGLSRHLVWKWNWSPNTSALIKYILGY